MAVKKHTVEQIIVKLREVEKLTGQGMTIPQAAKRVGVTDQIYYRWRTRYGALKEDEAKRLQLLEAENARLKRIIADQALDISMLKDLAQGKF
jgi:transposase